MSFSELQMLGLYLTRMSGREVIGLDNLVGGGGGRGDPWAQSSYFKGGCHLVFAKIVERRPPKIAPGSALA